MGRLRTAVLECKYKEVDRQLKEQFIHGLNIGQMLAELIRELTKCGGRYYYLQQIVGKILLSPTKCGEDITISSETVLA